MPSKLAILRNKLTADDMARHGTMMVVFTGLVGLLNYIYQLAMGWLLSPREYGILISLLSLLVIVSVFSLAVDTTVAKFVSSEYASDRLGRVNYLRKFFLKRALLLGSGLFLVLALLGPVISRFLNIDSNWYVWIVFASLVPGFAMYANLGTLRGLQRFLRFGVSGVIWALSKLGIAVFLVYMGLKVGGALSSFVPASLIALFASTYFLRDSARAGSESFKVTGVGCYSGLAFLAILAFAVLTNVDVVFARHYLTEVNAGTYSALSVMGKVIFFASSGIAIAMFPKTSRLFELGGGHENVLKRAVLLTLLLVGGLVLFYWLFPHFIIDVLFLGKYHGTGPYLFIYGLAMAFFGIANLLMYYLLSLNKTKVAYLLGAAALLEISLIVIFHANIAQIVNAILWSGAACLVLTAVFCLAVSHFHNNTRLERSS